MLILGSGSQAKVVADILAASGAYTPKGYVEAGIDPARVGGEMLGLPILGTLKDLSDIARRSGVRVAALAIGDNLKREELLSAALEAGLECPALVHPSAVISDYAKIGRGVVICAQAFIGPLAELGEGTIVNTGASVDHDCRIGRFVHVAVGARLAGAVVVGDYTTLGAGSCAIPGVKIGKRVTIGAGAAVVRDVPDDCTAVGVPAKAREP